MPPCKVQLLHHPCYSTTGDNNLIDEWVDKPGKHGVSADNKANSVWIHDCDDEYAVTVYEHGADRQSDPNQSVYTLKNGYWTSTNNSCKASQFDNQWLIKDNISSVNIEKLPKDNIIEDGEITYEIDIGKHYGAGKAYNTSLGGSKEGGWNNRWRPDVGNEYTKHPLSNEQTGDPCTSAARNRIWTQSSSNSRNTDPNAPGTRNAKMHCTFAINKSTLQQLNDNTKGSNDPRRKMYNSIIDRVCNAFKVSNPGFEYGYNNRCWDYFTDNNFKKDYCFEDNRMADDPLCTKSNLGDSYGILAEEYCKTNPDKEFCKCYNVVNYNTVCANRGTSKGCAVAKTKLDSIEEKLGVENATDALPCGQACSGNVYKPDGFMSGCDITYNACIQKIDVGASHDEINAVCNIDSGAEGQLTDGGSDGSGGSGGSSGSGGSGSVSTSAVEELKKTIAEDKKKEEEEAKKTKKKLIIGGGGGGIVSSISCIILIVIIVMVMSKKRGGRRRR